MDERLSGRLLGRAPELALLRRQLTAALDGVPSTVLIGGDARAGRTELVAHFCAELRAHASPSVPALVLTGNCQAGELVVPLTPLIEAFGLAPGDRPAWSVAGAPDGRAQLLEQVVTTLSALGRRRLVVLAVDDVHRAGPATLELLAYLAQHLRRTRVLMLLSWCSEQFPGEEDLRDYVARLVRDAGAVRVDLPSLAHDDLPAAPVLPVPRDGSPAPLTPRERQVLALLVSGARNRDIAGELRITEKTASVHVSNIMAKFGVRSRTAAAAEAHRLGVLR